MRIDLFEFVESVFRGFVYFFYNFVETLWDLTRSPRRGPVRRYRAHLRVGQQQIGGLTFFFVLIFAIFGICAALSRESLLELVSGPPDLGGEAVWLPLLGAMITTVLVDASVRLLLRWRLPGRPRKRQLALALFEYSLTWPVLLAFGGPLVLLALQGDVGLEDLDTLIGGTLLLWLVAAVASGPAAAVLLAIRRKPADRPVERMRRWIVQGLSQLGVFALLLAATAIGAGCAMYVSDTAAEDQTPTEDKVELEQADLRCILDDPRPHVFVGLTNKTAKAIVLDPDRDLMVRVLGGPQPDPHGSTELAVATEHGPDAPPVVIPAGATHVLTLWVQGRAQETMTAYSDCVIASRADWLKLGQYWGEPIERRDGASDEAEG